MPAKRLPSVRLMQRVGWTIHSQHPGDVFEERGRLQWRLIKSLLGSDWQPDGKRVFDFGCGVGRILLPALEENPECSYWACDVHEPSVEWLGRQVPSGTRVFQCGEWPPIDAPDKSFDLIYAFSVFTHLVDSWSAWLAELHRLLADNGRLIITVYGPGHEMFGDEPVAENIMGMNVLFPANSWDIGGPLVVHSEWWLQAHWGRAFEIESLIPGDPMGPPPLFGQGLVVLRRRDTTVAPGLLEEPEPGEGREIDALRANVLSLQREVAAKQELYESSISWRITAPLRWLAARVRQLRT